ncbi:MAG: flagellar hook-basal body complex protein FliE [Rhodospirillales bacterium]|nr:flagellar hook-basal body complex protein FliE [Rhodospirillales bacterium]
MPTPAQGYMSAINAYKTAAQGLPAERMKSDDALHQGEFADLVKNAIQEAVKIGERGESLSIAGINDRADINQVVTAVAEAEVALKTVVTVRDKVIDAYKEIIRMPM